MITPNAAYHGDKIHPKGYGMSDQFKPGDVVMLKSGGPKMTVNDVGPDFGGKPKVWCTWFEGPKKFNDAFEPTSLKPAVIG